MPSEKTIFTKPIKRELIICSNGKQIEIHPNDCSKLEFPKQNMVLFYTSFPCSLICQTTENNITTNTYYDFTNGNGASRWEFRELVYSPNKKWIAAHIPPNSYGLGGIYMMKSEDFLNKITVAENGKVNVSKISFIPSGTITGSKYPKFNNMSHSDDLELITCKWISDDEFYFRCQIEYNIKSHKTSCFKSYYELIHEDEQDLEERDLYTLIYNPDTNTMKSFFNEDMMFITETEKEMYGKLSVLAKKLEIKHVDVIAKFTKEFDSEYFNISIDYQYKKHDKMDFEIVDLDCIDYCLNGKNIFVKYKNGKYILYYNFQKQYFDNFDDVFIQCKKIYQK